MISFPTPFWPISLFLRARMCVGMDIISFTFFYHFFLRPDQYFSVGLKNRNDKKNEGNSGLSLNFLSHVNS